MRTSHGSHPVKHVLPSFCLFFAAALAPSPSAFGQGTTITGLSTRDNPGTPTTVTEAGATAPSSFAGKTLTLNFLGGTRTMSSYVTSLGTFQSIQVSSANFLRRNLSAPTPTNNIVWNFIVSNSGTTYNLAGSFVGQESTAFGGRDLNFFTGTDNIFGNQGDTNGNNNNTQRVDSIFSASGITVNNTLAFAVFERGPTNGHDGFKIAAITGLDANGNPSSYGPLISLATGAWGTTSLGPLNTLVTRNNANQPGANATHPSATASGQFLGGVSLNVIQDLGIPAGTKIFGYSLFAADIPANANLVNWNSFPTNTNSGTAGGIDLLAYNGVLYHEVPGNPGPTTDWALPANGNFSDPTNWMGQATPNNTDTATINNGTTATLTGSSSVANLDTGVGYSDANGAAVINGGNLSASGTVATGVDGTGNLAITNGGTVTDTTTEIGQNPGSNGVVNVDGTGSKLNGTGDTTVGDGGNGALNIINGGTVNDTNGTLGNQPGSSGTAIVDGNGSQWNNSGSLDVVPKGTGVVDILNGGAVIADGDTNIGPNGTLMGDGTITTPTLINNGTVAPTGPNNTPGTLNINGNYQQGPTGVLDTEVGGPQPSQTDQLKVTGTATLNGTLALTSLNNFHPASGDTFQVISTTGSTTGKFNQVIDTLNTTGLTRIEIVTPNGVVISYLRPAPTPSAVTLTTTNPVPSTLTAAQKNAFLVPIVDPNVTDLVTPVEVWFSLANTQRFNIQNRFDVIIAGSTGFVANVTYPKPPPTGKEIVEGKGVVDGKGKEVVPSPLQPSPENRWGVWVTGYGDFVNVEDDGPRSG